MMAIDFLIFAVLLVSFVINFLALAAFWVTPGLRTTANRFTINLLIINLAGCAILAPTLFLSGVGDSDVANDVAGSTTTITTGSSGSGLSFLSPNANDDSIEFYSKPGNHQMTVRHNGKLVEQEGIILRRNISTNHVAANGEDSSRTIETIYKCNATFCRELTIDEGVETLVITEIQEETENFETEINEDNLPVTSQIAMRSWSIDMAAALGAMAVLLVVGDTWCAVTDPLRYHSRISGLKSWLLIAATWAMGILFGALSAFREIDFESDTVISKQKRYVAESSTFFSLSSANNIFSVVFSCLYFVLIILLPFGFVCGMYWRIFSEARENGLRMRQNGSSPLLQSALNLNNQGQQVSLQHYSNSLCMHRSSVSSTSSQCGGLQMQIDQKDQQQKRSSPACQRRDSAAKVLLPPISDDGLSECDVDTASNEDVQQKSQMQLQTQQNIILTLQTASGEIKRNYSTRQLELLASSSQDLCGTHVSAGIRQVHSTPNLQRSLTLPQPLTEDSCSPHLLGGHLPQNVPSIHLLRHTFQQNSHHTRITHPHQSQHQHPTHHQSLQIPAIHASPKALSYMSSLRHRLSNASSLFKYREESRAARISILVVIMFLVSYLPYGFLVLLQSRIPAANFLGSGQLAIFMILLANLSSPFIFAYRNKRVRRGVKRLVGLDSLCRDGQLKRHSGSNSRLGNSKCASNLKRNSSRVSTYSTNSGRYLTPQSSLASNNTTSNNNNNNNSINVPLRPNSSCSTIINFALNNNNNSHNTADKSFDKSFDEEDHARDLGKRPRPLLQRGITIIEHVPLNGDSISPKSPVKTKLCKLFFKNSKNRRGKHASIQSTLDNSQPTDV